jgi:pyruvate/2-oxoglutarate dehydrogenase complex dihydrolipoamide dehydrogenase (E3) component
LPEHLIVLGGGYVGLELAQVFRRFGSRVTVIERGPRVARRENPNVSTALLDLFHDEGTEVLLDAGVRRVEGRSGGEIRVSVEDANGEKVVEGSDFLVAAGCTPNTQEIGFELAGVELDRRGYIRVNERLETCSWLKEHER